jgi:threonine/homoserine/homoserine lactone efflux protein
MGIELYLKGIAIGLMVSIPLGPIGVLCIQRTLNKGRRSGFVSGLGASVADTFFALVAGYGMSMVITFIKAQHIYFQVIGGSIIMYLGIHIFFTNPVKQLRLQRMSQNKLSQDFLSVLLLTVSNPMAIFFFLAMFAGVNLASGPMNVFFIGLVVGGVTTGSVSWWFILTTIVNIFRHKFRLKAIWWMNKISGLLIFFLGIAAILSVWFIK